MVEVDREVQKRNLVALSRNKGFQFTPTFFPYTSGKIGPYYVQSGDVMKTGDDFGQAMDDMTAMAARIIGENRDKYVISGGQTRDWIFSNAIGARLKLPTVMIYEDGKTVGANMKGKLVLPIADLNNEGSSPRDKWIPAIRKAGGDSSQILFYVDRLEEGVGVMKSLGLESYSAIPLDSTAWDILQSTPGSGVTPEIYKQLQKRMEDMDGWAKAMLRSSEGLETLVALLASGKTREKGLKILNVGYPDIKDEIVEKLTSPTSEWSGVQRWLA